jgi:DNA-binding Xre family transcriptional regulator/predicted RNA-binding Zn-ribbon protein involved in translation (DUF1610 family)
VFDYKPGSLIYLNGAAVQIKAPCPTCGKVHIVLVGADETRCRDCRKEARRIEIEAKGGTFSLIPGRLEALMAAESISRNALENRLHISHGNIYNWVSGKRHIFLAHLEAICGYYGVSKEDIAVRWRGKKKGEK